MNKTLETRFLGKDNVVSDVWYYCYAYVLYVVHIASVTLVRVQYCAYVLCVHFVMQYYV